MHISTKGILGIYTSGAKDFWDILQKILRNYCCECISEAHSKVWVIQP